MPSPVSVISLDQITISSDKVEGTVFDSPSTVSVKTDKDIDRQNINTSRELVFDEPGISVGNQPFRGGSTNFIIRGIGENRVRLEVDGYKVPDFPGSNIGAGNYSRDFVDFDALKRVEIIRGPASALYGSDAIGGVVSFITKDPADYLATFGKNSFASGKVGVDTTDNSVYGTATAAGRLGPWETMLLYTHRDGRETKPNTDVLSPNPQRYVRDNVLSKLVFSDPMVGTWKLTTEFMRHSVNTQLNTEEVTTSAAFSPPFGSRVFSSDGDDSTTRPRISFEWNSPHKTLFWDTITTKFYWTQVNKLELTDQYRATSAAATTPNRFRHSENRFEQDILGGESQANLIRNFAGFDHNIIYGITADKTETARPRDRYETNLVTNVTTKTVAGETYPNKNFPDTSTYNAAFYVQDIMQRGALRIIPAVRFDYYHLTPHPDADFNRSNLTGITVSEQTETSVSPKLGATYDLTPNYRLVAQYAHGFRAPPYDNINFGFRNAIFGYEILPNGNLKPEKVDSFEGGIRGRFDGGSNFYLTAFYNKYKDFIETVTVNTAATSPSGLLQFQYQNTPKVTIYGFEGKGEWWINTIWAVYAGFAYAHGTNDQTGAAIDSVDPFTAISGVKFRYMGFVGEARVRYVAEKDRVSDPTTIYIVPAHTTLDLLLSYAPNPHWTINAGVYNVTDVSYFNPSDVAGLATTTTNLELYRAPGRTFAMNVIGRW
ncbi:MAG: TonB-dependent hemoglobin/transferrin/lactoferrin family receptor [Pseudolabrys sp.]